MLLLISLEPFVFEKDEADKDLDPTIHIHDVVEVSEPLKNIEQYVKILHAPNKQVITRNGFEIAAEAGFVMANHNKKVKELTPRYEEYRNTLKTLNLEAKETDDYSKVIEFNNREENKIFFNKEINMSSYDGVLIGNDIPNWLAGSIEEHVAIGGWSVHYLFSAPIFKTVRYEKPEQETNMIIELPVEEQTGFKPARPFIARVGNV